MKRILIIAAIVFSGACMNDSMAQSGTTGRSIDSTMLSGDWWLQAALPSDTITGHIPNISFNLAKRTFKGFTGCNQMSGSFHVSGAAISFDKNITLTKIACEGYNEKDFIANLLRVTGYSIKDGVLTLSIDKSPISKWTRKSAKETVMR